MSGDCLGPYNLPFAALLTRREFILDLDRHPLHKEPSGFFDKPKNVRHILRGFYTICLGLLLADIFYHRHVTHSWESLWGFYPLYGFVACVVLVIAAKGLRKLVMRDPRYYDDD